jgi:hypothetical protein
MRTVDGKTDRVVVVGAGLAGLAAALHLAGRGRAVTVVERDRHPGGRVGRLDIGGYRLDTGPTVLTMPDIIDDAFSAVGETLSDRLELKPVTPAYHASFADGSAIDVHTDRDAMVAEVERFAGRREADGYVRLRDWLTRLYRVEFDGFIAANFDSPLSLLTPQLARLAAMGAFRRWEPMVRRFIADERLRRVFTFQALYAGVPPHRALPACTFPKGECAHCPTPSLRPQSMPASNSVTNHRFRHSPARAIVWWRYTPKTATGSLPTPSCLPPNCPTPTGSSAGHRAGCSRFGLRRRPSLRTSDVARRGPKSATTTSCSAAPGSRRSPTSSTTAA